MKYWKLSFSTKDLTWKRKRKRKRKSCGRRTLLLLSVGDNKENICFLKGKENIWCYIL
jgi:hypothetical protein